VAVLSPPSRGFGLRVRSATTRGGFAQMSRVLRDRSVQDALDDLRGER
jgi:hypothetical protein